MIRRVLVLLAACCLVAVGFGIGHLTASSRPSFGALAPQTANGPTGATTGDVYGCGFDLPASFGCTAATTLATTTTDAPTTTLAPTTTTLVATTTLPATTTTEPSCSVDWAAYPNCIGSGPTCVSVPTAPDCTGPPPTTTSTSTTTTLIPGPAPEAGTFVFPPSAIPQCQTGIDATHDLELWLESLPSNVQPSFLQSSCYIVDKGTDLSAYPKPWNVITEILTAPPTVPTTGAPTPQGGTGA